MGLRNRDRRRQPSTVTAAATRVVLDERKPPKIGVAKDWQTEAWGYFDTIPEAKFTINFLGDAMSRVRFFAATAPVDAEPDAEPVDVNAEKSPIAGSALAVAAAEEMAKLRATLGGQPALIRRMEMNVEVAGEFYLLGFRPPPATGPEPVGPEEWVVASVSELRKKGGRFVYTDKEQGGDERTLRSPSKGADGLPDRVDPGDLCLRVWQQHGRFGGEADSHMRGVATECRKLQVYGQTMVAEANSRMSAGLVFVADNVGPPPPPPPVEGAGGQPNQDQLLNMITFGLTQPIMDPSSALAVVPVLIRGGSPDDIDKGVKKVSFERTTDGLMDKRVDQAVMRFAHGMNVPVETVLGHQSTTFANATQIDSDKFDDHLGPRCGFFNDVLTSAYLRPNLADRGFSPAEVASVQVYDDPSAIRHQPDPSDSADDLWTDGVISDKARRRLKGFTEDDAPSAEERIVRTGLLRGILGGTATAAMIEPLAALAGIDLGAAAASDAAAAAKAGGAGAAAAGLALDVPAVLALLAATIGSKASGPDRRYIPVRSALTASTGHLEVVAARLAGIDRDLRGRLLGAADAAMTRALEKAGNKLRSKASAAGMAGTLRHVATADVARHLGRATVTGLTAATPDELLAGAWDRLEGQFRSWGAGAQNDAVDVASRLVSGWSTARRQSLLARQASDLDEAWAWTRQALDGLADRRMFSPTIGDLLGEFDPNLSVPPGYIRRAMEIAGGQTGVLTTEDGKGAWVSTADGGSRPVGGIGTGEVVREVLTEGGVQVEAYQWVYGPAFRQHPFEPHVALDGVIFDNFDDPVLAVTDSFPVTGYYIPGDHAGCVCNFQFVLREPGQEPTAA